MNEKQWQDMIDSLGSLNKSIIQMCEILKELKDVVKKGSKD